MLKILAILLVIVAVHYVTARPNNRAKRVTDTYLSGLETKIAREQYNKRAYITPEFLTENQFPAYDIAKRVSGPHLADLETKIAMNNRIKGFAIVLPVGAGQVDPYRIGRKRRSDPALLESLFSQSEDDSESSTPLAYKESETDYLY